MLYRWRQNESMNIDLYQMKCMLKNDGLACSRILNNISRFKLNEDITVNTGDVLEALTGMQSELGEISGPINKWLFQEQRLDMENVAEELGDLMWYTMELCHAFGWNMSDILKRNLEKIDKRYPDGFSPEKSRKRQRNDKL